MRRRQDIASSSTEPSTLVESAKDHHRESVKRASFLLFPICYEG